jgi:AraC family transcriptional regulator
MDQGVSSGADTGCAAPADVEFAWQGGSVHLRTQRARGSCERRIVREDLALGICFQHPGSAVRWHLDGRQVLDKVWSSSASLLDLVVLPPGHEFVGSCSGDGQGLWLFVDMPTLSRSSSVEAFARRARVSASWSRDLLSRAIAMELKNECWSGFPRGSLFLESASTALLAQLAYVLDKAAPEATPTRVLSKRKLELVLDYIQSNLERNVALAELAGLVGLTPRYFCEVFRLTMGRPPHRYQIEQRIERAKSLLLRPAVTVSEIALLVGFSSQSHLNSCFGRIVGVSPARYRAQAVGKQSVGAIARLL